MNQKMFRVQVKVTHKNLFETLYTLRENIILRFYTYVSGNKK